MKRRCWWLVASVMACTERVQLGTLPGDPIAGLVAIEVSPADTLIEITDLGSPAQHVDMVARGRFEDGATRDVTSRVAWSVDNDAPGRFGIAGPSTYTTSQEAAGHVTLIARAGTIIGTAALEVDVTLTVVDSTFPLPLDAGLLFTPGAGIVTGDAMRSPEIVYPAHQTKMPQGLVGTVFQHRIGSGNDAVKLSFESDVLHLTVFTGGDRWRAEGELWWLIARSHPGRDTTVSIDAASSAMLGTIFRGEPITLGFTRHAVDDPVYYFSDTTEGVMRGLPGSATAAQVFPLAGDKRCTGCHAISRDGRIMALGHGAERLATFDLVQQAPVITPEANIPMGWAAFSPDGQVLVADKGTLTLRDATTGFGVGPGGGRVPLPSAHKATHPDWSPDGTAVAVTLAATVGNMDLKGGSIAVLRLAGGQWSDPEILVQSTGDDDNNYFPKWSPDGRFIAYVHAAGPSRGAKSAELRLVPADGGPPVVLHVASRRVGRRDDVPDLASTMPSWSPAIGDDIAFLAFASARAYGTIRPSTGTSQIWVAAVDLAAGVTDPSYAAFWLPCQDITAAANNPIWAPPPTLPTARF